jgi:hypothetical protein
MLPGEVNSPFNSQFGSSTGGSSLGNSAGVLGAAPNSPGVVGGTGSTNLGVSPAARPCLGGTVVATNPCQ